MGFIEDVKSKYSKTHAETLATNILLRPRSVTWEYGFWFSGGLAKWKFD